MKQQETTIFSDTVLLTATAVGLGTLLATQSLVAGCAGSVVLLVGVYGHGRGWWLRIGQLVRPLLARVHHAVMGLLTRRVTPEEAEEARELYAVRLGSNPNYGDADFEFLADLGHVGVYGTTRFGKTTWLHSIIHDMINHHKPSELRICISDPKTVDYSIYSRLPHLLCPIARDISETELMIDRLIDEMNSRMALFATYAQTAVCNSLERYQALSGRQLPRVVAIFDELADVVQPGSEIEAKLIRLAKLSLAYGIHLICATQRPSSKVMNGEVKAQFASLMVTWMPNSREYGVVALVPKEMYQEMPRVPGRFMAYSAKGWRFVQGAKVGDSELAQVANFWAGRARVWESAAATPTPVSRSWAELSEAEKLERVTAWLRGLDYEPSLREYELQFTISRPTAVKYRTLVIGGKG